MRAQIEVSFDNDRQAEKALEVLRSGSVKSKQANTDEEELKELKEGERANVNWTRERNKVIATIQAKDYAALRARATSVLRDFKIVTDSIRLITAKK